MRRLESVAVVLLALGFVTPLAGASKREEAEKALKTLKSSRKGEERASAAQTLGSLRAPEAVPALALALGDPDENVRAAAAYSLWELRESAQSAKPAILAALAEENEGRTILNEIATLGALGVAKKELAPDLERALRDRDLEVRIDAAQVAIGVLPPAQLAPIAIEGLAGDSDHFTDSAQLLSALVRTGDRHLIPPLLEAAKRGDKRQVREASNFLALFEPRPPEVLPLLQSLLDDRDPETRRSAAGSLSRFMGASRPALPRLIRLLEDPSDDVREAAANCIDSILRGEPSDPAAISALIKAFESTRTSHAREVIVQTLGAMGPGAKAAIPLLTKELSTTTDASLRNQLQRTLAGIDPKR
jgi:HEAT repeat protein